MSISFTIFLFFFALPESSVDEPEDPEDSEDSDDEYYDIYELLSTMRRNKYQVQAEGTEGPGNEPSSFYKDWNPSQPLKMLPLSMKEKRNLRCVCLSCQIHPVYKLYPVFFCRKFIFYLKI